MFVLASASKARQKLLNQITLNYKVVVSDFDESKLVETDPCLKVKYLAREKANSSLKKLNDLKENHLTTFQALLACDSLFEFEGEIFGKPINKDQLFSRLQRMSGKSGFLHTGHHLISIENSNDDKSISVKRIFEGVVSTKIEFTSISTKDIIKYASISEPYQCAGGFAIEGKASIFIKNIYGCFSNVIGISLPWLKSNLDDLGLSELIF